MDRAAFASDVTREQFDRVRNLLEGARRKTRPRKHDLYDVFCAVLYFLKSGTPWRSMPHEFPPWRTVHEYFTQWSTARPGEPSLLDQALEGAGEGQLVARAHALRGER